MPAGPKAWPVCGEWKRGALETSVQFIHKDGVITKPSWDGKEGWWLCNLKNTEALISISGGYRSKAVAPLQSPEKILKILLQKISMGSQGREPWVQSAFDG